MATLDVTFGRAMPGNQYQINPLFVGSSARSETLTMPATSSLAAEGSDNAVLLLASVDCRVSIGPTPDATQATDMTYSGLPLKAGQPAQFFVATGDSVDVEAV